jgi:hypothetical protein
VAGAQSLLACGGRRRQGQGLGRFALLRPHLISLLHGKPVGLGLLVAPGCCGGALRRR